MEPWATLREAIPDGQVKPVALRMHVSYDYVLRWRRELPSDEAPTATGMTSPLTRVCLLIDSVFPENPEGAAHIVEHIIRHHQLLTNAQSIRGFDGMEERASASADILSQCTEAVISLNEGVTVDTLRKLIRLRDAADAALQRVGKDLFYRPPTKPNKARSRSK